MSQSDKRVYRKAAPKKGQSAFEDTKVPFIYRAKVRKNDAVLSARSVKMAETEVKNLKSGKGGSPKTKRARTIKERLSDDRLSMAPKPGRAGSPNVSTILKRAKMAEGGIMPLEFLLSVIRHEDDPGHFNDETGKWDRLPDIVSRELRIDCAKAAAPYCHSRLNAIDLNHGGSVDVNSVSARERVKSRLASLVGANKAPEDTEE